MWSNNGWGQGGYWRDGDPAAGVVLSDRLRAWAGGASLQTAVKTGVDLSGPRHRITGCLNVSLIPENAWDYGSTVFVAYLPTVVNNRSFLSPGTLHSILGPRCRVLAFGFTYLPMPSHIFGVNGRTNERIPDTKLCRKFKVMRHACNNEVIRCVRRTTELSVH